MKSNTITRGTVHSIHAWTGGNRRQAVSIFAPDSFNSSGRRKIGRMEKAPGRASVWVFICTVEAKKTWESSHSKLAEALAEFSALATS